ncbi:carboxylesterase/lipase family protein [Sphingomonas crusticola]|uniref:carboxylesterase/lipase family protein n=1 Tax=Sphingomonas crusticola TaxID=1697973 RepID=UPI0013C37624|nr:carboxylesterase family protein [Sphingomonas crusticola]
MARGILGAAVALLLMACGTVQAAAAPVAATMAGKVEGLLRGNVEAFLGIPYAAPPTGANRWRPPQPVSPWARIRPAIKFGSSCWQAVSPQGFGPWSHEYVVQGDISEDCLFLNVWTPKHGSGKLPVLVWIHGGGFNSGSGAIPIYDGRALAARGIVVVTINYRVGPFGFLAHPELTREAGAGPRANYGLQDMVAALRWVRLNIGALRGDPARVTIAGQSAGSMAVHELVASPLAKGLFARAIGESGLPEPTRTLPLAQAEQAGLAFAQEKGAGSIAALRAMPSEALVASKGGNAVRFGPVIDGVLLPGTAPVSDVPMLVGLNADEGSAMSSGYGASDAATLSVLLAQTYGAMASRFAQLYPAATEAERSAANMQVRRDRGLGAIYAWASTQRKGGQPTYVYRYDHAEPGPQSARWRAFHSSEIPYVFRTFDASPERAFTLADRTFSERVSHYWLNFIRSGDPNGANLPRWPKFESVAPSILALGDPIASEPLLPPAKLSLMKEYLAKGGRPTIF